MPVIDWQLGAAIATIVSALTLIASAAFVVVQLRQASRERYFAITAHLFEIWQSPEFQHDQLFLLHKLSCTTWDEFCALGRGEHPERAFHRIGAFYDRVGNLVRHNLIQKEDILPTIGGYAISVWHRIEPLVKESRLRENAMLFENYEALLPSCHECYVPGLAQTAPRALSSASAVTGAELAPVCVPASACERSINGQGGDGPAVKWAAEEPREGLTVEADNPMPPILPSGRTSPMETAQTPRGSEAVAPNGSGRIAPDLSLPDTDGIQRRISDFTASGAAVMIYVRGST
jgi:hypothetical protein